MAAAAARTTDPVLLLAAATSVVLVVIVRRHDGPFRPGLRGWLAVAVAVIVFRVVLRALLDAQHGPTVLFRLPEIPLPAAAGGLRVGGPVSAEALLAALYDGLRLAAVLVCIGAANVLADTRRLLKAAPAALAEVASALTIALSLAPQLATSAARVRRARSLRPGTHPRRRVLRQVVIPVVTDALERSVDLAAAMESRGHGRPGRPGHGPGAGALVMAGLLGVCIGLFGFLDSTGGGHLADWLMLGTGTVVAAAGLGVGRHRSTTTRYRPDPWTSAEWMVAAAGLAAALALTLASATGARLNPSTQPLAWPEPGWTATGAMLLGALPAFLAPPRPAPGRRDPGGDRRGADHPLPARVRS